MSNALIGFAPLCVEGLHLCDPLRLLQGSEEGVLGVRGGGAGYARPEQLLERRLHLSRVGKVHRHQLTVKRRVQLQALA